MIKPLALIAVVCFAGSAFAQPRAGDVVFKLAGAPRLDLNEADLEALELKLLPANGGQTVVWLKPRVLGRLVLAAQIPEHELADTPRTLEIVLNRSERLPYSAEMRFKVSKQDLAKPIAKVLELNKARSAVVKVVMLDQNNEPVAGQQVSILRQQGQGFVQYATRTTDNQGRVSFTGWGDKAYLLKPKLLGGPVPPDGHNLEIPPEGRGGSQVRDLRWSVRVPLINMVAQVKVGDVKIDRSKFANGIFVRNLDTQQVHRVTVQRDKIHVTDLPAGDYRFELSDRNLPKAWLVEGAEFVIPPDRRADEPEDHTLKFGPRPQIMPDIALLSAAGRAPVTDAALHLVSPVFGEHELLTDQQGKLEGEPVPAGRYRVTAASHGYAFTPHHLLIEPGKRIEIVGHALADTRVRVASRGGPLAEAQVVFLSDLPGLRERVGQTNTQGVAIVPSVPTGSMRVMVIKDAVILYYGAVEVKDQKPLELSPMPLWHGKVVVTGRLPEKAALLAVDPDWSILPVGMDKEPADEGEFELHMPQGAFGFYLRHGDQLYHLGTATVTSRTGELRFDLPTNWQDQSIDFSKVLKR